MSEFKILSDSSCDLPDKLKQHYNIDIVPFYVSFDSKNYLKENIDITVDEFYLKLKAFNDVPKTSLPGIQDYINAFKPYLDNGQDILCICLTSKFSGSYQSALNASNILKEDYSDRKIIIIDSMQVTAGQGLLVIEAADVKNKGFDIEKTASYLNDIKLSSKIVFTADSLSYLQKGGRIGKVASIAGTLLNIKPIIHVSDGELIPVSKVRGRKKALFEIINYVSENIGKDSDKYKIAVLGADCNEDTEYIKDTLEQNFGINVELPIFDVGVTIGSHIGPSATGIAFLKSYKIKE